MYGKPNSNIWCRILNTVNYDINRYTTYYNTVKTNYAWKLVQKSISVDFSGVFRLILGN